MIFICIPLRRFLGIVLLRHKRMIRHAASKKDFSICSGRDYMHKLKPHGERKNCNITVNVIICTNQNTAPENLITLCRKMLHFWLLTFILNEQYVIIF